VRLAHEVGALMVERGVEEEPLVLDVEVLVRLADAALSERDQLLTFGKRANRYRPFFESDWHRETRDDREERTSLSEEGRTLQRFVKDTQ
jgi:hypothetical protein